MRRFAVAALSVLFVALGAASCVPPQHLGLSTVVGGLDHPWDIAFTPDGTMLFTERSGKVSARVGSTVRTLAAPNDVVVNGEGGMLGLAVDPAFASNRYVYTCLLSDAGGGLDVRLARWRVDAGYMTLGNRTDILTGVPVGADVPNYSYHLGCRPRFGPDGYLWVTTGDGAIGSAPQDPWSLAGKVLRIDRDGNGAPGNPGGLFLPQIYTFGHRNPQGIAFRPYDGKAFSVEHGPTCDDEVNLLRPGGNYGWDPRPPGGGSGYDQSGPMTDKVRHPDAIDPVWHSGCPTIAPSGATFLQGGQWAGWDQALAVAVLKDHHLHVLALDGDGGSVFEWEAIDWLGRLRVAVEGPDGDLYLAQDANPGAILRVHPTP